VKTQKKKKKKEKKNLRGEPKFREKKVSTLRQDLRNKKRREDSMEGEKGRFKGAIY